MPVAVSDTAGVYAIEFLADDGEVIQSAVATVRETRFPTESLLLDPAIAELRSSPDEIQLLAAFRESVTDMRYWEDPFVAPVPGCFTSPFGVKRVRNGKPTGDYHRGVDQRSPTGYPVRAVAAGHQDRPAVHRTGRHRGSRSRPGVRNDVSAHVKLARAAECSRERRRCDRVRGLHRSLQRSSSPLGHLCEWCPGQSIAMGNAAAVQRLSQPRSQAITKGFRFGKRECAPGCTAGLVVLVRLQPVPGTDVTFPRYYKRLQVSDTALCQSLLQDGEAHRVN